MTDMTAPHIRAALNQLYPLADLLQTRLILRVRKLADEKQKVREVMTVVGDQRMELPLPGRSGIMMLFKVWASSVNSKMGWVLAHVLGDLWVFMSYSSETNEVYFWIVDGGKLGLTITDAPKLNGLTDVAVAAKLDTGVVGIYKRIRGQPQAAWHCIRGESNVARSVDGGLRKQAQEGRRKRDREGADTPSGS